MIASGGRARSRRVGTGWPVTTPVVVLAALILVAAGPLATPPAGAAATEGHRAAAVTVDRVDASGPLVVAEGTVTGADPATVQVSSTVGPLGQVQVSHAAGGLRHDVVAVIDTTESLGNGTVQLAKRALAPLAPGGGAASRLAVVTTGGAATLQVPPTRSARSVADGLATVRPSGTAAALWAGLSRAAVLLEDRPPDHVGTVVLFSAAASGADPGAVAAARAALRRAGVRLDVVAMSKGADVAALAATASSLGGTVSLVRTGDQLAGAFSDVADRLQGRFRVTFRPPGGAEGLVPLTVTAGGATTDRAYAAGSVRSGPVALAPLAAASGPGLLAGPLLPWVVVLLALLSASMLAWFVATRVLSRGDDLQHRLRVYEAAATPEGAEMVDPITSSVSVPLIRKAVDLTAEVAGRRGLLEKAELTLERANLPLRAAEVLFFNAALVGVLAIGTFFLTGDPLAVLLVAAVAAALPLALVQFRVRSRRTAFVRQLPDTLTLLAGTLKAGYSVAQGLESVSTEVEDPMGRELRRVVTETRLGRPLEESLDAVADRMGSDDFTWAVMAIRIQREVGGNLAELLMTVADTMTQRERLRREVSTLTAEGKMSAIIIGALPPALALIMFVLNPDYIAALFSPGLGRALLAGAVVLMGIGVAWMKSTTTIEV